MMCEQNITCSDPTQTVQYEFEYFDTESGYDRLFVNELMFQAWIHEAIRTEMSSDLAVRVSLFQGLLCSNKRMDRLVHITS